MDNEKAELMQRIEDLELRCKILSYMLMGVAHFSNPTMQTVMRRQANSAVLMDCPPEDRARRIKVLMEVFPMARDGGAQHGEFIPLRPTD